MNIIIKLAVFSIMLLNVWNLAQADDGTVVCSNRGGVEVTIEKVTYDRYGALFTGVIKKNGRIVRNTKGMRVSMGTATTVYSKSWAFGPTSQSLRMGHIQDLTDTLSLAQQLGYDNSLVVCDKDIPIMIWRK